MILFKIQLWMKRLYEDVNVSCFPNQTAVQYGPFTSTTYTILDLITSMCALLSHYVNLLLETVYIQIS